MAPSLAKVKAPLVCLNADLFPTEVEKNRKVAPQFQVRLLKGSGHWPMYDAPERFDGTLEEVVGTMIPPRAGGERPRRPPTPPANVPANLTRNWRLADAGGTPRPGARPS